MRKMNRKEFFRFLFGGSTAVILTATIGLPKGDVDKKDLQVKNQSQTNFHKSWVVDPGAHTHAIIPTGEIQHTHDITVYHQAPSHTSL